MIEIFRAVCFAFAITALVALDGFHSVHRAGDAQARDHFAPHVEDGSSHATDLGFMFSMIQGVSAALDRRQLGNQRLQ